MTRVRRAIKARREPLSLGVRFLLLHGRTPGVGEGHHGFGDGVFDAFRLWGAAIRGNLDELRALWNLNGAELLREWIDDGHPGTRPWAWWLFEAEEPRRAISGEPSYPAELPMWRLHSGLPWASGSLVAEAQAAYLARHDLLAPEERADLDAEDFSDEVIEAPNEGDEERVAWNSSAT
jgi:hypothetical protein